MVVIGIVCILAALTMEAAGFVQKKGTRSKAEAEIAAISAALESYKADNGDYPALLSINSDYTQATADPSTGKQALTGVNSSLVNALMPVSGKVYFEFPPKRVSNYSACSITNTNTGMVTTYTGGKSFLDSWGNSYGYCYGSTVSSSTNAYGIVVNTTNSTPGSYSNGVSCYDLWSTAGDDAMTSTPTPTKWIKNW